MRPELIPNPPDGGHLNGEQMVDLLYGEPGASEREHLQSCAECKAELEAYQGTLSQLHEWCVPERIPDYGASVWRNISGQLRLRKRRFRMTMPVLAWGAVAALGAVLFLGLLLRRTAPAPTQRPPGPVVGQASDSERLLNAAVRDHLERASVLLTEVENSDVRSAEPAWQTEPLNDLIAENRLYRETAEQEREHATAALLGEVESVLVDLQHVSGGQSAAELKDVRQRIATSDLRFKLRVFGSGDEARLVTTGTRL